MEKGVEGGTKGRRKRESENQRARRTGSRKEKRGNEATGSFL